jgi:hypothetical protein
VSHPQEPGAADRLEAALRLPRLRTIALAAWPSSEQLAPPTSAEGDETGAPAAARDEDEERWSQALDVESQEAADPYIPGAPDAPLVRRLEEEAGARPAVQFYADIVSKSADGIAMRARYRALGPMEERAQEEESILELADALIATGPGCLLALSAWFDEAVSSPDPWKVWAPVFVLGTLSGEEPLRAMEEVLESLPDDAVSQAEIAAEALWLSTRPDLDQIARRLLGGSQGPAVAVGIDVLSRRGGLGITELARLLQDPRPPVACAAAAATCRLPDPAPLLGQLALLLRAEEARVVQRAAHACVLLGELAPYEELHGPSHLAAALGAEAIELLVLCGAQRDIAVVNRMLGSAVVTAELLSAVGRFGHAQTWSFLLRYLADEDLAEHAAAALRAQFGGKVSEDDETNTQAWMSAIDRAAIDPNTRYRRGAPWRPRAVADECRSGALSRMEVALRLDELAARTGHRASFDLAGWAPHVDAALNAYLAEIQHHDAEYPAGSWRHPAHPLARAEPLLTGETLTLDVPKGSELPFQSASAERGREMLVAHAMPVELRLSYSSKAARAADPTTTLDAPLAPQVVLPFRASPPEARAALEQGAQPSPAAPTSPYARPLCLTLEQYASLCAELAVFSAQRDEVFARYGLKHQAQRASIDALWKERLREDPALEREWERYYRQYYVQWTETARSAVR